MGGVVNSRSLKDTVDMAGDDEHHPYKPTEPPDKPEGMRMQGGEQSVEEVKLMCYAKAIIEVEVL